MSAPYNPNIDLKVNRGHGLHLQVNRQPVPDSYGAIVMAELAHLCEFPAARVEVHYSCSRRPEPAAMARTIADELTRNEIWDERPLIAARRRAAGSARRPCLPVVQPAERNGQASKMRADDWSWSGSRSAMRGSGEIVTGFVANQ